MSLSVGPFDGVIGAAAATAVVASSGAADAAAVETAEKQRRQRADDADGDHLTGVEEFRRFAVSESVGDAADQRQINADERRFGPNGDFRFASRQMTPENGGENRGRD